MTLSVILAMTDQISSVLESMEYISYGYQVTGYPTGAVIFSVLTKGLIKVSCGCVSFRFIKFTVLLS